MWLPSWIFLHWNSQELSMLYSETVWRVTKHSLTKATGLDICTFNASKKVLMEWGTELRSYLTYSCIWTECGFLVYKLTSVFRQLVPFTYSGMLHRCKWDRDRGREFYHCETKFTNSGENRSAGRMSGVWKIKTNKKTWINHPTAQKVSFYKEQKEQLQFRLQKKCHSFATSTPSHHTEKKTKLLYLLCKDQWQFYSICYEQVKINGFTQPAMNR